MSIIFPVQTSSQVSLVAVSVVGLVLTIAAVASRVLARKVANRKVDASDYCSIGGCVCIYPELVVSWPYISDQWFLDIRDRILDMLSCGRVLTRPPMAGTSTSQHRRQYS